MILFIKHAQTEGPGTLGDFFSGTWQAETVELYRNEVLPSVDDCDAIISLGGPMNVYETKKYPFLEKEEELFRKALKKRIPLLGICLGAQLLAKVCGAKVTKAENREIGWYEIKFCEAAAGDPLFKSLGQGIPVFQWHEDTFEIPKSATLLASTTTCENQAFRVADFAWGLQFHPEMTKEMIETWLNDTSLKFFCLLLPIFCAKRDYSD
jgi:GMP synthase-like glutamine amidotransferase